MAAHVPVIREADGFVTCACGLRCGSLYFHALHSEEQLDKADHPTAWPSAHLHTVPHALWPQPGVIARNTHDLPATEYTTARIADGVDLVALRHALQLVPTLGRRHGDHEGPVGCGERPHLHTTIISPSPAASSPPLSSVLRLPAMVALGVRALAALAAPYPEQLQPFVSKVSGDTGTELFPAGNNDVLLFVKSSTPEIAADATAAFLAAAGSVLHDVETTGEVRRRFVDL